MEKERKDFRKSTAEELYQVKKIAVEMRKKGIPVKDVAEVTGLSENIIYITMRQYKAGGLAALKPKKRGCPKGSHKTLSEEQESAIIKTITDKTPDQIKMKCALWTRSAVQELIKNEYGIDMPIRTVGEYLRRWGFTVQRPTKQAINQKPEQVRQWLEETYPDIHVQAKEEKAEIFWGDETAEINFRGENLFWKKGFPHTPFPKTLYWID